MRLTFPNGEHAAVNIEHGQVGVGSAAGGGTSVSIAGLSPLHAVFAAGRRGNWLTVPNGATVVVNARPVKRIAFLRPGDLVCLGGVQVRLESDVAPSPPEERAESRRRAVDDSAAGGPPKAALRGLSGAWFGRCLLVSSPKVIGRGAGCDARIDAQGMHDRHAQIELVEGGAVIRALSPGAAIRVNGHLVQAALLRPGDQIELAEQRFVLEAPGIGKAGDGAETPVPGRRDTSTPTSVPAVKVPPPAGVAVERREKRDLSGVYLLIAAAAALAAALTAFFVYAPRG